MSKALSRLQSIQVGRSVMKWQRHVARPGSPGLRNLATRRSTIHSSMSAIMSGLFSKVMTTNGPVYETPIWPGLVEGEVIQVRTC